MCKAGPQNVKPKNEGTVDRPLLKKLARESLINVAKTMFKSFKANGHSEPTVVWIALDCDDDGMWPGKIVVKEELLSHEIPKGCMNRKTFENVIWGSSYSLGKALP